MTTTIPILTPSYFNSEACRRDAALFLDDEKAEGREDLVLPIYLIEAELLEAAALRRECSLRLSQQAQAGLPTQRYWLSLCRSSGVVS